MNGRRVCFTLALLFVVALGKLGEKISLNTKRLLAPHDQTTRISVFTPALRDTRFYAQEVNLRIAD